MEKRRSVPLRAVINLKLNNPAITTEEIADTLGTTVDYVTNVFNRFRHRLPLAQSVREIYLANPGITTANIARQVGISYSRALYLLKRMNLKPSPATKGPNAQAVIRMRVNNPSATLQEIGDKLGISKQRVAQLLQKAKLQTRHIRPARPIISQSPNAQAAIHLRAILQEVRGNLQTHRKSQSNAETFNFENPEVKFSEEERAARQVFWQNMVDNDRIYGLDSIKIVASELAYFAGIFDTEVYFTIVPFHSIQMRYDKHNENLLKIFSNSFGGKISKAKPRPERISDIWVWSVGSNQAYKILKRISPFLRIKREQARLCTECYEKCAEPELTEADKAKIGEQYVKLLKDRETKPGQRFNYFGLPHLKLAYIAGIFDVDSSFVITRRTEPGRNSYLLEVIKRKNDRETMDFIAGGLGGKIHAATKSRLNKQDIWEIKYTSQKAYYILKQIYPYLKAQKRIAEICMEFQDGYYQGDTTVEISPERKAIGEKYASLLQSYHLKWRSHYDK